MALTNWAGNYAYRARAVHHPASIAELQRILAEAPQIRVLGSRHSFTGIGDGAELVALDRLPAEVTVDRSAMTVTLTAGLKYGELAEVLNRQRVALANLASLPHISVAGAVATATHGSGVGNGNLGTSVAALEIVSSSGELITSRRGEQDFDGLVVSLGAAGAVTRLTLDVEPAYQVRQRVFEPLAWETLIEHLDEIMSSGYSVSVFSRWGEAAEQVWIKTRVTDEPEVPREELFGARAATVDRHPIHGLDPIHATPQLGLTGPWSDRLPHFRMGFTPSSGEELQSEYLVPRRYGGAAIELMLRLSAVLRPLTQVSELRTVAADRFWMSPAYDEDVLAIHFTWTPQPEPVMRALAQVEAALMPLEARPHWGKLFGAGADVLGPRYPRLPQFRSLLERVDPRGAFRNDWLIERVLGTDGVDVG